MEFSESLENSRLANLSGVPTILGMPELPEVEVLARHLRPLLVGGAFGEVKVHRPASLRGTSVADLEAAMSGARLREIRRRGKYLLFDFEKEGSLQTVLGHLGMTGRMYVQDAAKPLAKHAVISCPISASQTFVFEDTRYFGRFSLDLKSIDELGPEPLSDAFNADYFAAALKKSSQAIKVKLLDQALVAGIGNIYASESLFRAGIPPKQMARRLKRAKVEALVQSVREVIADAIELGSTMPLDFQGGSSDGLFYYGSTTGSDVEEQFAVYDREGEGCRACATPIRRIVQAARSSFYCPTCQRA